VKNTAQLSVLPMTEALKFDPLYINGSSDSGFTWMDLNRSSEMFIGGLPNSIDVIFLKLFLKTFLSEFIQHFVFLSVDSGDSVERLFRLPGTGGY
jgi:hypothetical protein